jgi:hypothetical protein
MTAAWTKPCKSLHANGLTVNKDKCLFSVPELVFFGFKISAAGLSPDDKKVVAIQNAPAPTNAGEVRSFLGLVNYCMCSLHSKQLNYITWKADSSSKSEAKHGGN